jgi:LPS export ABC transporter protein LptC
MMYRTKQLNTQSLFYKIVGLLILALFIPRFSLANKNTVSGAEEESDQQINDFSLAGYGEKGKKTWEISGKSADIFNDIIKLKQIVGNLYDQREKIKLTADKGDFNKENGIVNLEQNVIITTSAGARLTTDSLHWDRKNQLVSTKDKVNIQRQDMSLVAQGASGRPDLNEVVLEKDVQMNILPAEGVSAGSTKAEEIIITCDGPLQIDYQKNVAIFNNNVKVDREGMQISSDIMEVYFITSAVEKEQSPQIQDASMPLGGKIDKIVARGNVKITRGENVSYSEEATYSALDKKIILSGRPKLVIYSKEEVNPGTQ